MTILPLTPFEKKSIPLINLTFLQKALAVAENLL